MAGKHAVPKPSPYAIAAGAVAYATAVTFAKHLPDGLIASVPAAVAVAVGAVERGIADAERDAPAVVAKVDRLAAQAEQAAKDVAADVSAGAAEATSVEAVVKPLT